MKYIPKEQLIELYVNQKLTTQQIAKIYNIDRTTISNKLKTFSISINNSQREFEEIKKNSLTDLQKELIIGSVLGDGSVILNQRRKNAYFKVSHCEKQKDYLIWKKELLNNVVNCEININVDKRKNSIMYGFNTLSHDNLNYIRNLFYNENGIKIIKNELINYLTPFGISIWFMDDGSKSGDYNARISSHGFSYDENKILTEILKKKFDIKAKICIETKRNTGKSYPYLFFTKEENFKLTHLIKQYIVPCMEYKLIDLQRLNAKDLNQIDSIHDIV